MSCIRCGSDSNIEKHHIKQRIDGGSDDTENMQDLCRACHDYEHARREIVKKLNEETQLDRIAILTMRLEVLETLNTPEIILRTGQYTSYWIDERCHVQLPPKIKEKKKKPQLSFLREVK
jgi:hypothetical protein